MGEGWSGGWKKDMEVCHGLRLTFIHNIAHRWSAPGMRKQKGLYHMAKPYSSNLPYSAKLLFLKGRQKMRKRHKQTWRDNARVVVVLVNVHNKLFIM